MESHPFAEAKKEEPASAKGWGTRPVINNYALGAATERESGSELLLRRSSGFDVVKFQSNFQNGQYEQSDDTSNDAKSRSVPGHWRKAEREHNKHNNDKRVS
jgi:hypothetical protein